MNRGGPGVGSASILLVFTVLCLTIFAFITFETARTDKIMTETWAQTVVDYYDADTFAEQILAEILESDEIPAAVQGVDIAVNRSEEKTIVSFSLPVSESKNLYVCVSVSDSRYDVLEWKMEDIGDWEMDDTMQVWPG